MQKKQLNQKTPSNRTSLFSKVRDWCARHKISLIVFPIFILTALALVAFTVGSIFLEWDILDRFLTSPTGILVYAVLSLVALGMLYYLLIIRHNK